MAAVDDDDFEGFGASREPGRVQWFVNVAGAITSLALVAGLAFWGYRLAVRDVTGIPVVRALEGPMRIAPQDPGGEIAANVGLSVNEVAAEGSAAQLPDQMVLAPRPLDLSEEDQPIAAAAVAAPLPAPDVETLASLSAETAPPELDTVALVAATPVEQLTETPLAPPASEVAVLDGGSEVTPDAMESAVELALAEALGVEDLSAVEPPPPGAVLRSPRPERRPEGDASADLAVVPVEQVAAAAPLAGEVDVATIAPGTRMVQLGAFDDEADARAEWAALQARFGDLLAPKAMVLQSAESGGRSFVRLRALGFEDEADARRFCAALLAENATCIPVAHRL